MKHQSPFPLLLIQRLRYYLKSQGLYRYQVLQKINPDYPHETILVLDATTGQNAINQVSEFQKASSITSLIITKLDSEARAGVILSICKKFNLPIIAVGVGEKDSDLRQFNASEFTKLMLEN